MTTSMASSAPPFAKTPTPLADVDAAVARVAAKKDAWVAVSVPKRIEYLRACLRGVGEVAEAWVRDGSKRKGIAPGDVLEGEEWLAGPMTTIRNIRLLIAALEANGQPRPPSISTRPDGQTVARVFPGNLQDKLMFGGVTADVWIEKGKPASQGAIYREKGTKGNVALVLGAGNVSSIPPMDVLYKLFVENEVCVLKMNPVNADVGPHLERAMASLVDDGYLAIVYGGADVGAHLASHASIDTLHVTGSDRTYDAIVWGSEPGEQARRKAENRPLNTRRFTAELGCVTPVLIVPGPWTDAEMDFQARHVAGMVAQNGSFNCNAAKVLVTAKGWPLRSAFLAKVEAALSATPARKAYYPGAQQRYQAFLDHYPNAKPLAKRSDDVVPWTILPDVSPDANEYAIRNEAFCGVLAEVSLPATDATDFLAKATAFANDTCWGTLSTCMLVHPETEKLHPAEVDRAIADLRFGGIGVNVWPGLIYGLVVTTWGAFPGHTPQDIQSGAGVVHNAFLFDHPEKSVVRAPFVIKPTPAWFADHKTLRDLGRKLASFESSPGWGKLVGVAMTALRGLAGIGRERRHERREVARPDVEREDASIAECHAEHREQRERALGRDGANVAPRDDEALPAREQPADAREAVEHLRHRAAGRPKAEVAIGHGESPGASRRDSPHEPHVVERRERTLSEVEIVRRKSRGRRVRNHRSSTLATEPPLRYLPPDATLRIGIFSLTSVVPTSSVASTDSSPASESRSVL